MLSKIPERSENGRSNDPATSEGTSTGTILWELALLLLLLIGAAFVIKQQVRLQHIREEVDELKKDYKGMQEGRSTLEERLQAVPKLQKWAACMEVSCLRPNVTAFPP